MTFDLALPRKRLVLASNLLNTSLVWTILAQSPSIVKTLIHLPYSTRIEHHFITHLSTLATTYSQPSSVLNNQQQHLYNKCTNSNATFSSNTKCQKAAPSTITMIIPPFSVPRLLRKFSRFAWHGWMLCIHQIQDKTNRYMQLAMAVWGNMAASSQHHLWSIETKLRKAHIAVRGHTPQKLSLCTETM